MFEEIKRLLGETGSREIRLTQSEYDATQHELCQSLAQMLWGDKGLAQSLGSTWLMVMDPRFSACERTWIKNQKVTATESRTTSMGVMIIDDQGNITTPRMISLEQYAEILGEGRHYAKTVRDMYPMVDPDSPVHGVKDWDEAALLGLLRQESPNYFTKAGQPNQLAQTWVKMFKEDILGMILDYSELSNINQWVLAESGDVVLDRSKVPSDVPVVHAEVEYLDRALLYRTILRANTMKVLAKLGGEKFAKEIQGVDLTELEKDDILRETFNYKYDELYKALPVVLQIIQSAKNIDLSTRTSQKLDLIKKAAQKVQGLLKSGELKPLDLLDGDVSTMTEESLRFQKISHSENLVALFYMLVQAEAMVKDYPDFKAIVDLINPILETAEDIDQTTFEGLCEQIQSIANAAIENQEVCEEGDTNGE